MFSRIADITPFKILIRHSVFVLLLLRDDRLQTIRSLFLTFRVSWIVRRIFVEERGFVGHWCFRGVFIYPVCPATISHGKLEIDFLFSRMFRDSWFFRWRISSKTKGIPTLIVSLDTSKSEFLLHRIFTLIVLSREKLGPRRRMW